MWNSTDKNMNRKPWVTVAAVTESNKSVHQGITQEIELSPVIQFKNAFMKTRRISTVQLLENSSLCWINIDTASLGILSSADMLDYCMCFVFVWSPCKVFEEDTIQVGIYCFSETKLYNL